MGRAKRTAMMSTAGAKKKAPQRMMPRDDSTTDPIYFAGFALDIDHDPNVRIEQRDTPNMVTIEWDNTVLHESRVRELEDGYDLLHTNGAMLVHVSNDDIVSVERHGEFVDFGWTDSCMPVNELVDDIRGQVQLYDIPVLRNVIRRALSDGIQDAYETPNLLMLYNQIRCL